MIKLFLMLSLIFIIISIIIMMMEKEPMSKILLLNFISNLGIIFIVLLSTYKFNYSYIDVGIIYAFVGFIAFKAYLKYYSTN